jgi:hypothetical protein
LQNTGIFNKENKVSIFININSKDIADIINSAESRVIYAAPALDKLVAEALINRADKIGIKCVSVLLDMSENVFRCGYGNIEGVTLLNNKDIPIKEANGIRIGVLVCDNEGYVFSQIPLLIEADKNDAAQPNAMRVSPDQVNAIVNAITPQVNVETQPELEIRKTEVSSVKNAIVNAIIPQVNVESNQKQEPEIGKTEVSPVKIASVKKALTDNPPQKFDIARKVHVFSTAFEFVELKLTGCEIQRHTVQIPTELLVGNVDLATKKQLKAGFNIIGKNSSISGDSIRDEVNKIRKDYTKSIPKYGNILLKSYKNQFNEAIVTLKKSIEAFQLKVKENLEAEIAKAQTELTTMLTPAIHANPPTELTTQVLNGIPTEEQVKKYIEIKLKKIFPDAEKMTKAMSVDCIFKAVTYEAIFLDNEFQNQIREAYPLIDWDKMLEEYNAAPEN